MSKTDRIPPRQLEQLLQALEDGTISAEERDLLDERLLSCADTREKYFEHMLFSSALHSESGSHQLLAEPGDQNFHKDNRGRALKLALFSAAAAVMILGTILSVFHVKPLPPATVEASRQSEWKFEKGGILENRDFQPNTRINVAKGMVRIGFSSGSSVTVKGPAKLVITNRMEVALRSGVCWFEIDDGDKGFTVKTKTLTAVDLGTVFGVSVSKSGDSVHVESGLVRVESVLPHVEEVLLEAGKAIRSNSIGHLYPTHFDSRKFTKSLVEPYEVIRMDFD